MGAKWDFCGWATKNDLKCSDGRVIRRDAFADQDGMIVPLVWQHQHDSPDNVLGHALLENRKNGVFAYCSFNNNPLAQSAKESVRHGDIKSLSIYANRLQQNGSNVLHGAIREVSLVLTGANPGASIQQVALAHGDGYIEDEAIIYTGEEFTDVAYDKRYLNHADDDQDDEQDDQEGETVQDVFNTLNEKQKKVVYFLIGQAAKGAEDEDDEDDEAMQHADEADETVQDVFNTLNEKQKKVVYFLIGQAAEGNDDDDDDDDDDEEDDIQHSDYDEEDYEMKRNLFDNNYGAGYQDDVLSHAEEQTIFADGKKYGTLKESFLAHAEEYGIDNIDYLFPEPRATSTTPEFIERDRTWVDIVMGAVKRSPFSRIKSVFANITDDDARAKGYFKGNLKKNEVFALLKRVTTPTTIYKKQQLDRDDVVDITDFDVVAWIKTEMRAMLDEEIARAILFGDGRDSASDDKVNEQCIRPIVSDGDLYAIKEVVPNGSTTDETMENLIKVTIKAKAKYKGSGDPTLFTSEEYLADLLLLEDGFGHPKYKTTAELAARLRVKAIVSVPSEILPLDIYGVVVNLKDYNVGADKGGAVNMFDDFDIDYNQQKYLIETRCSGALVKPYSAIVLKKAA